MDNKNKILLFLVKHLEETHTMHGMSKATRIPYATFYRTIRQMPDLLAMERVGNNILLSLQIKNQALSSYLAVASYEEKKEFLQKQLVMGKIAQELGTKGIVLLFGSYAQGKQNERSDIDLLIINKDGKRKISFSRYEMLFKIKINPIFITFKELQEMLKDREENVGKQALKNHIVLNNPQRFWELVLDAV